MLVKGGKFNFFVTLFAFFLKIGALCDVISSQSVKMLSEHYYCTYHDLWIPMIPNLSNFDDLGEP